MKLNILFRRTLGAGLTSAILLLAIAGSTLGQDAEWRPVLPEDMASKAPAVEPDADAEAIFWEVRIDDSSSDDLFRKHYVRVKIFTERGREKYSKFDIPFTKGTKIKDLAARVIRADGSIVEIKKEDIFEREIVRASGLKIKAKSFAVPNIEPGVMVEYRYKESIADAGAAGMRLQFQRDIPVRNLSYYYKPYNDREPKYQNYNFSDTKFIKDKGGYYLAQRNNVASLKEEPRMPPDDMVRAWMLLTGTRVAVTSASMFSISYAVKDPSNMVSYWGAVSAERSGLTKLMSKPGNEIKKLVEEITAGAQTPDEKLRKIYVYCQTQIANTTFDTTLTDEQRAKLPEFKSVNDVIKRKSGSAQHIDLLFGSMAAALGYESRVGLVADRSEMFFNPNMTNEGLVHLGVIGVKVGNDWKFFNPGMKYLPYGALVWYEENTWVLLVGTNNYAWQETPFIGHDTSQAKRSGKFKLLDDGTLEGEAVVEYSGQPAIVYRSANYDESAAKREEDLKQELKTRMSTAEISAVSIENVDDASKPLIKRYKLRVPNYAQKTGKRMFFQPGVFEFGEGPLFSSSSRKHDIFFRYPWSEVDDIEITYPTTFDLDNADAPGTVADADKVGSLEIRMGVDRIAGVLKYDRKFHFGGGGNVLFKSDMYVPLKNMFDGFHKADTHTITLRQK